jgi:hypothetical protein
LLVRGDESRSSLPPPPTPALLDYQSAQTDQGSRTRSRAVTFWSIGLIVSWAPFVCGVVNALVAAQKYYSPAIVKSHFPASIGFMTMGRAHQRTVPRRFHPAAPYHRGAGGSGGAGGAASRWRFAWG